MYGPPSSSRFSIMAVWEPEALLSHPVDYRLVHNTFVTMFWNPAVLRETTAWLADHRYHVVTMDASGWSDPHDMHREFAVALNFPDYYGRNLDALNDCMRDVAAGDYGVRPDATGLALVLLSFEKFTAAQRGTAQALLDIFAAQARNAALIGRRMMCLVQSNDARLNFEPVGATPVMWNDAEWPAAKRGL
jgi:RNAse (barnase) inhibitor barstar